MIILNYHLIVLPDRSVILKSLLKCKVPSEFTICLLNSCFCSRAPRSIKKAPKEFLRIPYQLTFSYSLEYYSGEGNGTPLQYSCLENPMDGGAWWAAVHGVAKSQTWLSDFNFTFHFYSLEKEMATHSSVLAWRIPGMEEPGGLPSMGSHRVRHNWSDAAAAAAAEYYSVLEEFPTALSFYNSFSHIYNYYDKLNIRGYRFFICSSNYS